MFIAFSDHAAPSIHCALATHHFSYDWTDKLEKLIKNDSTLTCLLLKTLVQL